VVHAAVPDFEQRLVDFGSTRFRQLRPGQRHGLAAYAEQHLDIGNHRKHNLLNAPDCRLIQVRRLARVLL
jgi:hypothetical protein